MKMKIIPQKNSSSLHTTLVEGAKAAADKAGVQLAAADAGDDASKQVTEVMEALK
ncbi:MAG: hypothetical protein ACI4JN_09455 [Ruminococcus sp.]